MLDFYSSDHNALCPPFTELEVQYSVQVKVASDADIFAIKLLNILGAVNSFLAGVPVRREIPIFGAPFHHDIFMIGLIDEIRVDPETFDWDILELKTRKMKSVPSKVQKTTHHIQVMLYKRLFDDLVTGKTDKELLKRHLKLDFTKEFGADVMSHCKHSGSECKNLDQLWDLLKERMSAVPLITQLLIEYCYQEDKSTIAVETCEYKDDWLREKYGDCVRYWRGEREVRGVDIEDAWKCQKCDFADVCDWRERKANEYKRKNVMNCGSRGNLK